MRGNVLIVFFLLSPWNMSSHPDDLPSAVLETSLTMVHNRDLLGSLPAYTCLETIAREQKDSKQKKTRPLDIVQVDVGVGKDAEIYSWPGEKAFSSIDLGDLIGYGFAGTGLFQTFASNTFVARAAIVRYAGEQVFQGRAAIHFTYTFPSLANNWIVDWKGATGIVGESGEFWVDKVTQTLVRLEVAANNFPPTLPLKAMNVAIEYETLAAHHKTVLIPSSAEIVAIEMNGAAYRDLITFSQCHLFEAQSRMQNSPEALVNAIERYEAVRHAIPAGVEIPITFESEIRVGTATIGKSITARLNKALKISPDLIVPSGAVVSGRIREFREIQDSLDTFQVGLEFNEIDWRGNVAIFFGDAIKLEQIAGLSTLISRSTMETSRRPAGLLTTSTTEKIRPRDTPGVTTFFLASPHVIPKGFQMTLRTRKTRHL